MDKQTPDTRDTVSPDRADARGFAARRTVLKGLTGLPVAVTLASGQSAAAASALQCAESPTPIEDDPFVVNRLPAEAWEDVDPMVFSTNYLGEDLYVNGNTNGVLYERTEATDTQRTYVKFEFTVDADGDGVAGEGRFLLASCYNSFVNTTG